MVFYPIDEERIQTIPFEETFRAIIGIEDQEFYGKCGREHYRLLSYLSTCVNHSIIIDIGTHRGSSSLALSFNETNTIYSFDIVDNVVNPKIKERSNIHFSFDNLFESDGQEKWKDTILSAPFILLDVDPHNGHMEWEFYQFLQKIQYQGFVICDDVWYFKEMRDHFWYQIPDTYKYDLTLLGHWSGTGIFTFIPLKNSIRTRGLNLSRGLPNEDESAGADSNLPWSNPDIQFPKENVENWTLVTAYFDLTKCPDASEEIIQRNSDYYFHHSLSTLLLPYNLVIYCDSESMEKIKSIRSAEWLKDRTKIIVCEFDQLRFVKDGQALEDTFADYRNRINQNRKTHSYHFDNRNTASYYLFCMSRYIMLKDTIEKNPFRSTHFGWINFCIERMGYQNLVHLNEAMTVNRDKFSSCYIDYIPETLVRDTPTYFQFGRCGMCSGFFTGNLHYMYKVCDLIEDKFLHYLELGYGHADEQLYTPIYFDHPDLFEHYYGDYLQMITNYKYVYDCPQSPMQNFIRNSFSHQDYARCIEGCTFLLKSVKGNKCVLSEQAYRDLLFTYTHCILYGNLSSHYLDEEMMTVVYHNMIQPCLSSGDNKRCFDLCEQVLAHTLENAIYEIHFLILFCYYVSSFYVDRSKANNIVQQIVNVCKQNQACKNKYMENRTFYDEQFSHIT